MGQRKGVLGTNGLTPDQGSFSARGATKKMFVNFHFIKKNSRSFVGGEDEEDLYHYWPYRHFSL